MLSNCARLTLVDPRPWPLCGRFTGKDRMETLRANDIKLLKFLGVRYICDLMVEMRKTMCVA